jgi:hypothetical protein
MSIWEKLRSLFRRTPEYRIELDETGFRVDGSNGKSFAVAYAAISSVAAYKRDQLTVDLICFAVSYLDASGADLTIEVDEDMAGFDELDAGLARALAGFDRNWRDKVVKPAFAENRTLLFEKSE